MKNFYAHGILALLALVALSHQSVHAADIYIDPSANDPNEDGSFAHPFNSWEEVTITAGNDYRQKCGTVYKGCLRVTARGTPVLNAGKVLDCPPYDDRFMTGGTDFGKLPGTADLRLSEQSAQDTGWTIGPFSFRKTAQPRSGRARSGAIVPGE